MTFEINDDVPVFHCDTCPEEIECPGCGRDFTTSLIYAKGFGWKSYKGPDKEWAHACPVCVADWSEKQREQER